MAKRQESNLLNQKKSMNRTLQMKKMKTLLTLIRLDKSLGNQSHHYQR